MLVNILITLVFFLILMFVSANLLGLLVRGLFTNPELDKLEKETEHDFLKKEIAKSKQADKVINIIALVLIIAFFFALYRFWNMGVLAVALIIMTARLPDLLWEIRHGRKVDPKLIKKDALYYATSFLSWIGLPLLYFSLY